MTQFLLRHKTKTQVRDRDDKRGFIGEKVG